MVLKNKSEKPSEKENYMKQFSDLCNDPEQFYQYKEFVVRLFEIEKANIEADNFLADIDKRMAKADLEYAKLIVQENIDTLKIARGI